MFHQPASAEKANELKVLAEPSRGRARTAACPENLSEGQRAGRPRMPAAQGLMSPSSRFGAGREMPDDGYTDETAFLPQRLRRRLGGVRP
jgi:hypothetical protein